MGLAPFFQTVYLAVTRSDAGRLFKTAPDAGVAQG